MKKKVKRKYHYPQYGHYKFAIQEASYFGFLRGLGIGLAVATLVISLTLVLLHRLP